MMPASRAVSSGSPFFRVPARTCLIASADSMMCPRATASRAVTGLWPTSTMRMRPDAGSMCVSLGISLPLHEEERQPLERDRQVHPLQLDAARDLERPRREIQNGAHTRGHDRVDGGLG